MATGSAETSRHTSESIHGHRRQTLHPCASTSRHTSAYHTTAHFAQLNRQLTPVLSICHLVSELDPLKWPPMKTSTVLSLLVGALPWLSPLFLDAHYRRCIRAMHRSGGHQQPSNMEPTCCMEVPPETCDTLPGQSSRTGLRHPSGSEPESFGWSMRSLAVRLAPESSCRLAMEESKSVCGLRPELMTAFAKEMQLIRDFKPPTAFNKIETSLLSNQAGQTDIGRGKPYTPVTPERSESVHFPPAGGDECMPQIAATKF
ncbi:hypothetical protein B0H13DRAFT_1900682 [Mycena leptocephala]|nr:hypothetical protein B0H13DRAFT_1900682 [Mycena leptocephala]